VYIAHQQVVTPWDQKGVIMRTLVERSSRRDLILVDGVKVPEDDGWVLVLPDPEEPLTHVWAEGPTESSAASRVLEQAARIRQMMR
jgi:mannose-1-phosphate guanylyltransferase/phosphomannomutase